MHYSGVINSEDTSLQVIALSKSDVMNSPLSDSKSEAISNINLFPPYSEERAIGYLQHGLRTYRCNI